MGVALSPCTIPAVGEPTFTIGEDELEISKRGECIPLETAEVATEKIIEDLPFNRSDEVSVLVKGLGATARIELIIFFRKVSMIFEEPKINIINHLTANMQRQ